MAETNQKKKSETSKSLWKYPVIALTIVISMWLAELILGLDFSEGFKISKDGLEVNNKEKQNDEGEIIQSISQLKIELETLKELYEELHHSHTDEAEEAIKYGYKNNLEKLQTVANMSLTKLSYANEEKSATILKDESGYIWIGDYDNQKNDWLTVKLKNYETAEPISFDPKKIKKGAQFKVSDNMVLRKEEPKDNLTYYRKVEREGIIPTGTLITILEDPIFFEKEKTKQIWAKIKVEE